MSNYKFMVSDSYWTLNNVTLWLFTVALTTRTHILSSSLSPFPSNDNFKPSSSASPLSYHPLVKRPTKLLHSQNRDQAVTLSSSYLLHVLFLLLFQQKMYSSSCWIFPLVPLQFFPIGFLLRTYVHKYFTSLGRGGD